MSDMIWESTLDDVYRCKVERTGDRSGVLTVTKEEKVLLTQDVTLSYDALFGPDVDDVVSWQDACVKFVDGLNSE